MSAGLFEKRSNCGLTDGRDVDRQQRIHWPLLWSEEEGQCSEENIDCDCLVQIDIKWHDPQRQHSTIDLLIVYLLLYDVFSWYNLCLVEWIVQAYGIIDCHLPTHCPPWKMPELSPWQVNGSAPSLLLSKQQLLGPAWDKRRIIRWIASSGMARRAKKGEKHTLYSTRRRLLAGPQGWCCRNTIYEYTPHTHSTAVHHRQRWVIQTRQLNKPELKDRSI